MTTTIDLTDEELAEVKALTAERDTREAVLRAIREYIRYAKRMRLKELSDKVTMENNWEALERREMDSDDGQARLD